MSDQAELPRYIVEVVVTRVVTRTLATVINDAAAKGYRPILMSQILPYGSSNVATTVVFEREPGILFGGIEAVVNTSYVDALEGVPCEAIG